MRSTQNGNTREKNTISKEEVATVNETFNQIATGQDSKISKADAFKMLEEMPDTAFQEQTGNYLNFENLPTGKYDFIFEGMTEITVKGKTQKAVRLTDKNNNAMVSGSTILVNTCEKFSIIPTFIRVVWEGEWIKTTQGEYAKIRVLTPPVAKS